MCLGMASQSLLAVHDLEQGETLTKNKKLREPLLGQAMTLKERRTKEISKLKRRIRHCQSSPDLDVDKTCVKERPKDAGMHPKYGKRNSMATLLTAALVFIAYLGSGIIIFYAVEHDLKGDKTNSFVDALYFCIVTMTTVGYGDLVPAGVLAKLFTCVYVFAGFGLVGLLLSSAADFLVERQETLLAKALSGDEEQECSDFGALHQMEKARSKVVISGLIVLILIIIGVIALVMIEGMGLLDAFYCVCVTVTTLGYGDVSFSTKWGRTFAIFWIVFSTISVAQFFLYSAEYYTESRRQAFLRWVLTRKTTFSDLAAADMDGDGVVSAAEFIVYKLKELGKVEEQDVLEIMKEFDSLDVDNSGTVSSYDLKLARAAEMLAPS